MQDHEHADIGVYRGEVAAQVFDLEGAADLGGDVPGGRLARLAGHGVDGEAALDLQAGDEADDFLLRVGQGVDEPAEVVFEEAFFLRVEEGDDLAAVGGVDAHEAEVEVLALLVEGHADDAGGDGLVFGLAEGRGVDDGENDFAAADAGVFLEEFTDALGVGLHDGAALREARGVVEGEFDGLCGALGDVARALGEGVHAAAGGVEAHAAQAEAGDHVDGDEDDECRDERADEGGVSSEVHA